MLQYSDKKTLFDNKCSGKSRNSYTLFKPDPVLKEGWIGIPKNMYIAWQVSM